jgi:hypothetical protein
VRRFSPTLGRLLFIKGVCRAGPPAYVLWSIVDWCRVDWRYALAFAALSFNYVIIYSLTWTYPALMQGPWRVRPWQTLMLAANAVVLPVMFHRAHGHLPWITIAAAALCLASLYIGAAIYLYLNERLPMAGAFASRRDPRLPVTPGAGAGDR